MTAKDNSETTKVFTRDSKKKKETESKVIGEKTLKIPKNGIEEEPQKKGLESNAITIQEFSSLDDFFAPSEPTTTTKAGDTEVHKLTKHRKKDDTVSLRRTTVYEFDNVRTSKAEIYHGSIEVELALIDLVKKTNEAIENKEIFGKEIKEGHIVQGSVVSYNYGKITFRPRTTEDSPLYGTFPFEVKLLRGCLVVEPCNLPEDARTSLPKYVGDLIAAEIPEKEERRKALVALQLREVAGEEVGDLASSLLLEEGQQQTTREKYHISDDDEDFGNWKTQLQEDMKPLNGKPEKPEEPKYKTSLKDRLRKTGLDDFRF